jgi:DNA-binding transcriptional regulator YiaG
MTDSRQAIAESLAAGYRTDEVAEKFSLSPARIAQLRREFEASWRAFQQQADEWQETAA